MYTKDGILADYRELLKIKIKSLAAESRIIRQEEQKTWGDLRASMSVHRRYVVRSECRHALAAYALVRGKPIPEGKLKDGTPPLDMKKVEAMVKKYGITPAGIVARDKAKNPAVEPEKIAA